MNATVRLCPQCTKVSYVMEATWHSTCPHCGFVLGDLMERRSALRYKAQYPSIIWIQEIAHYGFTLDLSGDGMRIIYYGRQLEQGTALDLSVDTLNIRRRAEVVWSRQKSPDISYIGLRLV